MIYYKIENLQGDVLANNFDSQVERLIKKVGSDKTVIDGQEVKLFTKTTSSLTTTMLVVDESDLLNSSKLSKKYLNVYEQAYKDLLIFYEGQIDSQAHTLLTIKAQMTQKLNGFESTYNFIAESYGALVERIKQKVVSYPKEAAELICYFQKRLTDLDSHMTGFNVLTTNAYPDIEYETVSLRRAILNIYSPFEKTFFEKNITLKFYFSEDETIQIDRKLFNLIMFNIFENACKYAKNDTVIKLNFRNDYKSLDIGMVSLKIEKGEINDIFLKGKRGIHSNHVSGNGIGLYVVKRALSFMGMSIFINSLHEKSEYFYDKLYVENHFILNLKKTESVKFNTK